MNNNKKNQLRKKLRASRNSLTKMEQRVASVALAKRVTRTRTYCASKRIALYFASDGEISTDELMARIWRSGRQCYMPILSCAIGERLWFAPVDLNSKFQINRFGIPEPAVASRKLVDARRLDLILMPMVGFDLQGNRLGMGGGFYDRTLAFQHHRQKWVRPRLIGLAHECQRVDKLEISSWDVPLHAVATDKNYYQFKK
ncbi:MAG: 5-formyltetrahydrofolate cyclo-ligase [Acidiferrobacterales bacterium]